MNFPKFWPAYSRFKSLNRMEIIHSINDVYAVVAVVITLGTLSKDDDDGSENVVKKRICVLSNLIASIWTRSICQMQATFPGVEFLRILFRFKKRTENLSSYVHVLHKTPN